MTIRIAMWSPPRCISTTMMRSFSSRADCEVSDEPFYGAFLKDSGERHPMTEEIMAAMDCDWASVLASLNGEAPGGKPVWYQKHIIHHMIGPVGIADMPEHRHAFLVRAPERIAASYRVKNADYMPDMLGYGLMRRYFDHECDRLGQAPPVVDSDTILIDPASVLEQLCGALGIAWDPAMLSWDEGPHPADGVWGPHWYDKINASTGFGPPRGALPELCEEDAELVARCRPHYEAMLAHAFTPR